MCHLGPGWFWEVGWTSGEFLRKMCVWENKISIRLWLFIESHYFEPGCSGNCSSFFWLFPRYKRVRITSWSFFFGSFLCPIPFFYQGLTSENIIFSYRMAPRTMINSWQWNLVVSMVPNWRLRIRGTKWWRCSVFSYLQLFLLLVYYSGANRWGAILSIIGAQWQETVQHGDSLTCNIPSHELGSGAMGQCSISWCYRMQWAKNSKWVAVVLPFQHPSRFDLGTDTVHLGCCTVDASGCH